MGEEITEQHPLFEKYTRAWLHQVTGFSKGYLSRLSTGKASISRSFILRVCSALQQPEDELFLPQPKSMLPHSSKTRARLLAIIEGMSIEELRLLLRFAEFLAKQRG
ncbi:hypothetical protein ES708_05745 [subsurface metagenome]